jgi:glycosyltransferase involved in cell wall biosynthesis
MIEFIIPSLRNYNREFYENLNKQYRIKFIFTRHDETRDFGGIEAPDWWNYENINIIHANSFHPREARNWLHLAMALIKDNYDLIFTGPAETTYSLLALIISKLRSKRIIFGSDSWYWPTNKAVYRFYYYALIQKMLDRGDALLAVGEKQYAFFKYILKKTAVFYMPPYVVQYRKRDATKLLETLALEDPRILGKKIIMYMSRIVKRKGLNYLIEAFKLLENKIDDIYLLIVGSGEFEKYCKNLAKNLGVKNIMFRGYIDDSDVELYHNLCDILVLPSIILDDYPEPDGYVVYESMSVGKPLVVTDAVGATQMVKNGINGFVVENRNVVKLADALFKILQDEELRKEMSKRSKEIFEEKISLEKQIGSFRKSVVFVRSRRVTC